MARNKQNQKQKKDGNHRKESKEEKRLRIQAQKEAQEVGSSVEGVWVHLSMNF